MVFDYLDHDLTGVLHHPSINFSPAHLKSLMQQFLEGLGFIHRRGVLHRDLKGSNILLSRTGVLKIADFGLARFYQRGRRNDYTNRVITQWYKPPELLFGATVYDERVDMWSAGCVLPAPLFRPDTATDRRLLPAAASSSSCSSAAPSSPVRTRSTSSTSFSSSRARPTSSRGPACTICPGTSSSSRRRSSSRSCAPLSPSASRTRRPCPLLFCVLTFHAPLQIPEPRRTRPRGALARSRPFPASDR